MPAPQHLRVFLASPGDVADERALARRLIEKELPSDPLLHGQVTFEVVSWDDPVAPIALPARLRPQEAIIRFGTRPSKCDVVVVVLWSRLGTHLDLTMFPKANGEPYLSGTEWEYEDACKGRPEIFIYRRTEVPNIALNVSDLAEKVRQYQLVGQFCEHVSKNPDGSFRGNITDYATPTVFKERLATDLKFLLRERLGEERDTNPSTTATPVWTRPPYPGLRSFTPDEGPIFYGRGREVDALIARLRDPAQRFLAVVGASGTGKSSLIHAGLIPRLHDGAIEGSQDWRVVTCTPGALGDNPFLALAVGLVGMLPTHAQKPPIETATVLAKAPQRISEYAALLTGGAVMLFVDQLEELFTHAAAPYRKPFGALLAHVVAQPHLRVVATLREDFLSQCTAMPDLAPLLQAPAALFPPAQPGSAALAEMISRPAERAGLEMEPGLADEILKDAGTDPGVLPLMAFCLEELYQQTAPDHRLTLDAYDHLGRLRGAISRRAAVLLEELREAGGADLDAALPGVFRTLIHVDAAGTATRHRAFRDELGDTPQIQLIIDKLVKGRLLAAGGVDGRATVTLAHEALISKWPALHEWLNCNRIQLQRIQLLIANLTDVAADVRWSAARALGQIGPAAVPALITVLIDINAYQDVRGDAAEALGLIGPATAEVVPVLITVLGDANKDVRWNAACALGQIGSAAAEAVPALITALGDANEDVRWNAAWALGQIGSAAAEAVPALITALGDANEDVRWNAFEALGQLGPAGAKAVLGLITLLGDADIGRQCIANVLGLIGPATAEVVPVLITVLGDANEDVRWNAACVLGQIGPPAAAAVPALTAALQDPNQEVIKAAKDALQRIQSVSPAANSD
jgi:HEAT repeat protein